MQETTNDFIKNEIKADYVTISLPFGLPDPRPFSWTGYEIAPRYDYVTDLRCGYTELWKQVKAELRQSITRAEKKGVIVETGQKEELELLFYLMQKRYEEQNMVLPISKEYLLDVYSAYKDNFHIFVGKFQEETVTGIIHVAYKDRFFRLDRECPIPCPDLPITKRPCTDGSPSNSRPSRDITSISRWVLQEIASDMHITINSTPR